MRRCSVLAALVAALIVAAPSVLRAQDPRVFRWAGDPEGGAPYVEASPTNPEALIGFDVEIAELIARGLHLAPKFVLIEFSSIDQSIARGDAEIGMGGIEDTPAHRATLSVTVPYYEFREVLSVRDADAGRYRTLQDLAGRRVGTLGGTIAYDILLKAQPQLGLVVVPYEDDVHPYQDLVLGRVDAVLLDNVLAERRKRTISGFAIQPESIATSHYVGVLSTANAALRDRVDEVLRGAMRDGALEAIFRKWELWSDDQAALYRRVLAREEVAPITGVDLIEASATLTKWAATKRYLPALLRASLITIVLSCVAMLLAVTVGVLIASGRVYGSAPLRWLLTGYVELMRGTPILLQLFVLYYGIASAVKLPAFVAALLGLALNYGAYESEIYRGALESISPGQLEAARTLGFSERQILWLIRGPQAFRLALPPMTNDFVALLKDSALVSVLTVVELTKQTQIFATNLGSWVIPGFLCAGLYLAMSLPLSALARRFEQRWKAPTQ
ncbi:MAG: ABC transporter substrate-binding protein/permease [Acidobacteriaceae bacterium]|jgi:polar amino acid transport system substrate-binding protein|nr:ABC transporter substrate-binding protein/permease [Acidobacteriaceae bacterium]